MGKGVRDCEGSGGKRVTTLPLCGRGRARSGTQAVPSGSRLTARRGLAAGGDRSQAAPAAVLLSSATSRKRG